MLSWMIKTLWLQKVSVLVGAVGAAFSLVLLVIMDAAFVGESTQIVSYIKNTKADVWVLQKGVHNMHMATTFVWDWKVERIMELPGVERATPILYVNTAIKAGERNWFAYVVGLRPDGQRAGPWAMAVGQSQPGPGEIILPVVLANMAGVDIGDTARIADKTFKVAGLSEQTFSMANSIAFVSFADLEDLISTSGTVSLVLVDIDPGQDPSVIARNIEAKVEKVTALPQGRFMRNDFQIAMLMGVEIVSFMTMVSSVLAALIIAFASYSQVARRQRELAIAKALGYPNRAIYLAVIGQSIIIASLSLVMAFLIAWLLVPVLSSAVPIITLVVTKTALLRMTVVAFVVAVLAALIPARLVARVDPATVFRV